MSKPKRDNDHEAAPAVDPKTARESADKAAYREARDAKLAEAKAANLKGMKSKVAVQVVAAKIRGNVVTFDELAIGADASGDARLDTVRRDMAIDAFTVAYEAVPGEAGKYTRRDVREG